MRNEEIRPCAICGKGIANNGQGNAGPFVGARVTVQPLMVDPQSMNAHLGLEQHFALAGPQGARALADIMGPGSVIDEPDALRSEFLVCQWCLAAAVDMPPLLVCIENDQGCRAAGAEELEEAPADE